MVDPEETPFTITINMDKACSICGRKGAEAKSGVCLTCVGKRITEKIRREKKHPHAARVGERDGNG